jgi:hypothetical protein
MTAQLLYLAGSVCVWGGLVLRVAGVIGTRRYWLIYFVGETFWAVRSAALGDVGFACFFGAAAVGGYIAWRNSDDDDDDRWRRLLAWGRSKIPRPTVVRLRPALEER